MILRAADRIAVPWKNGGGLTREVAAHPPYSDLGNFDWRVSLAEVARGGPFSPFPGVDRHMAVISGRMELSISGRGAVSLSPESVAAPTLIRLTADTTLLLALAKLGLRAASIDANLSALDAARFSASAETVTVHSAAAGAAYWLVEIRTA